MRCPLYTTKYTTDQAWPRTIWQGILPEMGIEVRQLRWWSGWDFQRKRSKESPVCRAPLAESMFVVLTWCQDEKELWKVWQRYQKKKKYGLRIRLKCGGMSGLKRRCDFNMGQDNRTEKHETWTIECSDRRLRRCRWQVVHVVDNEGKSRWRVWTKNETESGSSLSEERGKNKYF